MTGLLKNLSSSLTSCNRWRFRILTRPLSLNRRVGGKELDGFNGNIVKNMFLHGETLLKTKHSGSKQDRELRKQTDKLQRFIPKPKFGVLKTISLKTKGMKFDTQQDVDLFVSDHLASCAPGNVSDLMHAAVKVTKKRVDVFFLREHLSAIAKRLKQVNAIDWKFRDISTIMYGLQCSNVSDSGVIEVLTVITTAAEQGITDKLPVTSQDASMMLLGLRRIGCEHLASRRILSVATKIIKNCTDNYDDQNIGNSLLGLQGMSSDCLEVTVLLDALTVKVRESTSKFSSQALGNALYGLRGMSSDCPEVRSLLSALTDKVLESTAELSAQAVSNSLNGLKGMSSEYVEVRTLLSSLIPKYRASTRRLSSQEIGDVFYGMRSMDCSSPEVRELLSVLLFKLNRPTDDLSIGSICASLSGLQNMNAKTSEAREVLTVLMTGFTKNTDELSPRDTGNALEAVHLVREVLGDAECKGSLIKIFHNLNRILYRDDGQEVTATVSSLPLENVLHLYQSLSLALCETQILTKPSQTKGYLRIHALLTDDVADRRANGSTNLISDRDFLGVPCTGKSTLTATALKTFSSSDVVVELDTFILNLFKADLVLRVPVSAGGDAEPSNKEINFEIFSENQKNNRSKSFCNRRDAFFASKGVIVERIEATNIVTMSESALVRMLKNAVSKVQGPSHFTEIKPL